MTYAGEFITCSHCGYPITGERKIKKTKTGEREYVYYHCAKYNRPGQPRTRVTETELDRQMWAFFDRMRIEDENVREWFRTVLRSQTADTQKETQAKRSEVQRQLTLTLTQRDREASLKLQLEVLDRSRDEIGDLAVKVFELSQTLREQWLTADYAAKRRILEIVCLNCRLDDANLVPTMRKPFDVLAEGSLISWSRDEAHSFEQMEALAATCVREYPVDRPPQLRFLAGLVNEPSES